MTVEKIVTKKVEGLNKDCVHVFEDEDYYLVSERYRPDLFTDVHKVNGRKVHVCLNCNGVFATVRK